MTGERPAHGVRTGRFVPRSAAPPRRSRAARTGGFLAVIALAAVMLWLVGTNLAAPALGTVVFDLAKNNPSLLTVAPVADVVRGRIGPELNAPAGTDPTVVHFEVPLGASATDVARDLGRAGLVKDEFAVTYLVITENLSGRIEAGTYELNQTMSPRTILGKLQQAPVQTVTVRLREGLRIEQITAYLETLPLKMDVQAFYDLAEHPTPDIIASYPFLSTLPAGHSLEGFLGAGTFDVYEDVTPDELIRDLLDQWQGEVGMGPVQAAQAAGRNFYQVLILASIVEQEARVDQERPLIAGVYANRLAQGMILNADPTVIYAWDTAELRKLPLSAWQDYVFWNALANPGSVKVPKDLQGFQTYVNAGQVPWPICTPTAASIQAALHPDTKTGYLYFVAKNDGSYTHAFSRTYAEQLANMRKYGYIQ